MSKREMFKCDIFLGWGPHKWPMTGYEDRYQSKEYFNLSYYMNAEILFRTRL